MNSSKLSTKSNIQQSKTVRLPIKIGFHSNIMENEQRKPNNLFNILTRSFKPIVDCAHRQYVKDQYSHIVNKVETERLNLNGKKSEVEKIYEKLFKKSSSKSKTLKKSRSQNKNVLNSSVVKKPVLKKQQSFLMENNIIDKKDILNNHCNRNYARISQTPDTTRYRQKSFYERDIILQKSYEDKKELMRIEQERRILSELKPTPGIYAGSQKIIAQTAHLEERDPLHLRFKEVLEQKSLRRKSMRSELLKRDDSANSLMIGRTRNRSSFTAKYECEPAQYNFNDYNNNIDNYNSSFSINNKNIYKSFKYSNEKKEILNDDRNNNLSMSASVNKGLLRAKSCNTRDFKNWIESKQNWLKQKEAKTEQLRNEFFTLNKAKEEQQSTFAPEIDAKSDFIARLKNENENPNKKTYEKLYSLQSKKKEKIQLLQLKYKPSFKPNVNKFPKYLLNNTTNQTTFYIEEKEDDYANFALSGKSKARNNKTDFSGTTRTGSRHDRKSRRESNELRGNFNCFGKEVENNFYVNKHKSQFKKSQKEIGEFFFKMNKGESPNLVLEVEDIKFYNRNNNSKNKLFY